MQVGAAFVMLLACISALVSGCSAAPASASAPATPTWERPGLGGAVRPEMGSPQPGEPGPDFDLPGLDGASVKLSSLRGSWVLMHFTATWCPFCDSEVSHLGEVADAFAARGVRTVIVDVEEPTSVWRDYAKAHVAPSVLALHDASGAAAASFAPPRAQPSFEDRAQAALDGTLILDPRGTIRLFLLPDSAHFDPTFKAVRAELDRLVPEPVVSVRAPAAKAAPGAAVELAVTMHVAAGYHVMSDHPSAPTYIPTRLTVQGADGVTISDARYPAASPYNVGSREIATFVGDVDVKIPIAVASDAATGPRRLHGAVRYQACTESRCLFPTTREFELTLDVAR